MVKHVALSLIYQEKKTKENSSTFDYQRKGTQKQQLSCQIYVKPKFPKS